MSQCLRITFIVPDGKESKVRSLICQEARKLILEGMIQTSESPSLKLIACGTREKIDQFLDALYKAIAHEKCDDLEIEPFFKDRDYRGVFRIIE